MLLIDAAPYSADAASKKGKRSIHHMVIALDVSPSMQIKDAGPAEEQTREDRGRDVLRSLLDRIDLQRTRISIVAFYSEARPVVVDTVDLNVVSNIIDDLPLEYAFTPGKTNLYKTVEAAAEVGKRWPKNSASLVAP